MSRARYCQTILSLLVLVFFSAGSARAQNAIVTENALPGNPPSEWDVSGAGDQSIQGFATDISVDQGGTIEFKIRTDATSYRIDIYRLGYYGGDGARKVATVFPSATLPQSQPACVSDAATGCLDCGNWDTSASWAVPTDATSGIYLAKLVRYRSRGWASQPHRLHRARRRRRQRSSLPDLRHHMAGLQPLGARAYDRRLQHLRGSHRQGRQDQLQPALRHPRLSHRRLALQRRVPDGALARAQRLRRELLHRRGH